MVIGLLATCMLFDSVTHIVDLTESTIKANSRYFKNEDDVPKQAISMGLANILQAKRIILLAFGEKNVLLLHIY